MSFIDKRFVRKKEIHFLRVTKPFPENIREGSTSPSFNSFMPLASKCTCLSSFEYVKERSITCISFWNINVKKPQTYPKSQCHHLVPAVTVKGICCLQYNLYETGSSVICMAMLSIQQLMFDIKHLIVTTLHVWYKTPHCYDPSCMV